MKLITQTEEASSGPAEEEKARLTNPQLSANLRGDYEALQNDLEQANQLAVDFQSQLAGKSNEVAHLKQVFEKTARDLANLQQGITALREERHRLANEAMRAVALEHRLGRVEAENARLQTELEKAGRREHERESKISQLTAEVEKLRKEPAATRVILPPGAAARGEAPDAQDLLTAATDTLARLREIVNANGAALQSRPAPVRADAKEEFIDISFEP